MLAHSGTIGLCCLVLPEPITRVDEVHRASFLVHEPADGPKAKKQMASGRSLWHGAAFTPEDQIAIFQPV